MPKKKINKKDGFRFTLLHRSQQDPLYHDDENGSKLILHPADRKTAEAMERGAVKQEGALNYVTGAPVPDQQQAMLSKKRKQDVGQIREFREVDEYGLPLDGYDYTKHLSSVGGGAFISAEGIRIENAVPAVVANIDDEDVLNVIPATAFASATEQPRFLEAITLRPDNMDEDMKHQFEDDDAEHASVATGEWGDLPDEWLTQIVSGSATARGAKATEEEEEGGGGDMGGEFDFDAHMARLMKEAEAEDAEDEEEDEEDEYEAFARRQKEGISSGSNRKARDVDDHFNTVLAAEYENDDDDDYDEEEQEEEFMEEEVDEDEEEEEEVDFDGGDLSDDADEMGEEAEADLLEKLMSQLKESEDETRSKTSRSTKKTSSRLPPRLMEQTDPIFMQAIEEFLEQKKDDQSLGDVAHPPAAKETLRLVKGDSNKLVEPNQLGATNVIDENGDGEEDEEDVDLEPEEPPKYEEFLKLWGTYSATTRPQFDCQTIVSTRSTTDNLPTQLIIARNNTKKKKKMPKAAAVIEEESQSEVSEQAELDSITRDVARLALQALSERTRGETPEERKARKSKIKDMKRERRAEKKQVKEAFKKERVQVVHAMTSRNAPMPGVSEFKI